jgi:hypothetical protein
VCQADAMGLLLLLLLQVCLLSSVSTTSQLPSLQILARLHQRRTCCRWVVVDTEQRLRRCTCCT